MPASRRHFLQASAITAASSAASAQSGRSVNDRIQIAGIGIGGMGFGDLASSLATPGVQLVAVADVYQGRLERAKELYGNDLMTTRDYRQILARPDIDAVVIATPDHWHATIAIEAMRAGKDVYVEKPMVHRVEQLWPVIDAAKQTGRILQVGSQRVSSILYTKARDLIREGAIGEVNFIEAWWDRNSAIGAWQYSIPTDASPNTIDWDSFLGPAKKVGFEPKRLFRWRNYQDYGTGVAGDLFVHLFSGMHYIMDVPGPTRVFATGGLRYWNDGRDVPDVFLGLYDYPKGERNAAFNLALRVNFVNGAGENSGFRFVGTEGVLTLEGGITVAKTPREKEPGYTIGTFTKKQQEEFLRRYRTEYPETKAAAQVQLQASPERYAAPRGYSDHRDHHANFYASIRSRQQPVEDATFGARAAGPALLSNLSYFEQRPLGWSPVSIKVVS
jgi:predicted dehydrogenase